MIGFSLADPWLKDFENSCTPTVLYDNYITGNPSTAYVGIDNDEGMELAVSHLVRQGHRKIAYLSNSLGSQIIQIRYSAFFRSMRKHGLKASYDHAGCSCFLSECMEKHLPNFLKSGMTAIICSQDTIASAALVQCQQLRYRVPEDVSIVGFDDLPIAAYTSPPLTTIRQDRTELGKSGFFALSSLLNHVSISTFLLHAQLIERKSTFGTSICYTSKNIETVTSDEFFDLLIEHGCRYSWYFHYMPVGNDAAVDLLPTKEQREYMYHRVREIRGATGGKQIYAMDFQNDGEFVGGCIAGGRNYCHINANGDVEPCVFIHYSSANIKEVSLLEALKQPLFMAYRDHQPFNNNHLRPCPMLENPEILQEMVEQTGAKSTDLQSPETVEHLCGKCADYACQWKEAADKLWEEHPYVHKGYSNYKKK